MKWLVPLLAVLGVGCNDQGLSTTTTPPAAQGLVDMSNHERFMDRFVDWHVEIMATEPFDILANASWLPDPLIQQYETLWTERRIQKVLDHDRECCGGKTRN